MSAEYLETPLRMVEQPLRALEIPYLEVPTELLWEMRDPQRWDQIIHENIDDLKASMRNIGQREPIVLIAYRQKTRIKEGHHRLRVGMEEGWDTLKTRLVSR